MNQANASKLLALCMERPDQVDFFRKLAEQSGLLEQETPTPTPPKIEVPTVQSALRSSEPSEELQYLEMAVQESFGTTRPLLVSTGKAELPVIEKQARWCCFGEAKRYASSTQLVRLANVSTATLTVYRRLHKEQLRNDREYRGRVEAVRLKLAQAKP